MEGASSFSDWVALHTARDGPLYEKKNYLSHAEMQSSDKKKGFWNKNRGEPMRRVAVGRMNTVAI